MCGIAGFDFDDIPLAKKMCNALSHRGPDDEGYYNDAHITLGHRRLSIIDLNTGKQPIYNEDKSIVVVYNGEIYNFRELKSTLESKGHRFYTSTDTEVIVHAYEEFGHDCVKLFNGMFAFAVWDSDKKELFLARDITGIKPLHYTFLEDGKFIFASEIKAILQYEKVKREMDPQALHFLINLRYLPREQTMFRGIKRLLPAHRMVVNEKGAKITKYWEPKIRYSEMPESYYIKRLRLLLEAAVKRHLISDVPVGACISGGIDSSAIVALASRGRDAPLKTFCMGFGAENDEISDARIVAEHFGTDHHELIVESSLLKDYGRMIWYADEPKRNLYPYYIYGLAGRHVKSALSGLGGDELFGGYVFKYEFAHKIEDIRNKMSSKDRAQMPKAAGKLIRFQITSGDISEDDNINYLEAFREINDNAGLYTIAQTKDKVFDSEYLKKIYGSRMNVKPAPIKEIYAPYFKNNLSFTEQMLLADFSVKMADDFLLVDDRMSMAHSIESRVPFLDKELIEFAFTIPPHLKISGPNGKYILRMAMKDLLPREVLEKKKQGFASSTYDTYVRELREIARQKLPCGNLAKEGYLNKAYIEKVLNAPPNPRLSMHYSAIWNMLAAEMWYGMLSDNGKYLSHK